MTLISDDKIPIKSISINKWKEMVQDPLIKADLLTMYLTSDLLIKAIHRYGIKEITFTDLDMNNVQIELLAMALRTTSKWKDDITGWHTALEQAKVICKSKEMDLTDILFGLI